MRTRKLRADAFPEALHYKDTGCPDGGPSCLRCPLATCVLDDLRRRSARAARVDARADQILALRAAGLSPEQAAAHLGISRRTVFRLSARRHHQPARRSGPPADGGLALRPQRRQG